MYLEGKAVYQRYANWPLLSNHLGIGRGATSHEIIRSGLFINHSGEDAIITIQLECTLYCTVHTMGKTNNAIFLCSHLFFVSIHETLHLLRHETFKIHHRKTTECVAATLTF
jgi:hypothetical protein